MARLIDWINNPAEENSERTRKAKPPVPSRKKKVENRTQPPVMVRGSMAGIPLAAGRSKKAKARRRYDLSLSVPGAEMRLPAIPAISVGPRLLSAILAAGLLGALYILWTAPMFAVGEVNISGLQRLSSMDVNTVLNVSGERIFAVNPSQLEQKLMEAFPEFSSASVEIVFPGEVVASVVERSPILTWIEDGRTQLIDADGVSFPLRNPTDASTAIVVHASSSPPGAAVVDEGISPISGMPVASQFLPVEMVSGIVSMSALAPQGTPLVYDQAHGLGWKDAQGWDVFFGDVQNIDLKLRIYQALLTQLQKEKVNPVLISVEYVHTPYYRLER